MVSGFAARLPQIQCASFQRERFPSACCVCCAHASGAGVAHRHKRARLYYIYVCVFAVSVLKITDLLYSPWWENAFLKKLDNIFSLLAAFMSATGEARLLRHSTCRDIEVLSLSLSLSACQPNRAHDFNSSRSRSSVFSQTDVYCKHDLLDFSFLSCMSWAIGL